MTLCLSGQVCDAASSIEIGMLIPAGAWSSLGWICNSLNQPHLPGCLRAFVIVAQFLPAFWAFWLVAPSFFSRHPFFSSWLPVLACFWLQLPGAPSICLSLPVSCLLWLEISFSYYSYIHCSVFGWSLRSWQGWLTVDIQVVDNGHSLNFLQMKNLRILRLRPPSASHCASYHVRALHCLSLNGS